MGAELARFLALVEARATYAQLGPSLTIDDGRTLVPRDGDARAADGQAADALAASGWCRIDAVVPPGGCVALADAVRALDDAGLPTTLAYVWDQTWSTLDAVRATAAKVLGAHAVLADVWAFRVAREAGARGWVAHRGSYELERRADGRPLMLNVWIALTEASRDNACVWLVPRADDPAYPDALADCSAPEARAVALECPAGAAIIWDANTLHWGGTMSDRARSDRVSLTFTLRARDARDRGFIEVPEALSLRERLDLVARQLDTYRDAVADDRALQWASLTGGLERRAGRKAT